MTTAAPVDRRPVERDPVVEAAVAGDDGAFATLVQRHRGELLHHCTRMLHSSERAEDAVQEALLRAWRSRSDFAGRATFRSWLHRIATNTCLDEMRRDRPRSRRQPDIVIRLVSLDGDAQLPPGAVMSPDPLPDALLEAKEAVRRALLASVELLPPRQRAALILCEVMRCPATEAARLLGTTVAAVTSALQRARTTLGTPRTAPARIPPALSPDQQELLDRYAAALRRHDTAAVVALARADMTEPAVAELSRRQQRHGLRPEPLEEPCGTGLRRRRAAG